MKNCEPGRIAQELLERAGIVGPPVNLDKVRRVQRIWEIIPSRLGNLDACLMPASRGYAVMVNQNQSPLRQRFSLAHEIAHTCFSGDQSIVRYRHDEVPSSGKLPRSYEEWLCNEVASELLMPSAWFREAMNRHGDDLTAVRYLAKEFMVSIQSAAIKVVRLRLHPCALINWNPVRDRVGRVQGFSIRWASVRGLSRKLGSPVVRTGTTIAVDNSIQHAFASSDIQIGKEVLNLGTLRGILQVQSLGIGSQRWRYVLSLIDAER